MNIKTKSILTSALKILACTVIFTMCFAVVSFADKPEYTYENAEALLKEIGVLDAEFKPVGNIKRDEFVNYTMKLIGLDGYKTDKDIPFLDMAINDPYYSAVAAAYDCGIVHGNSSNTFAPSDDITLAQASKILSGITGYSPLADANGGYSAGYLITAGRAGLLDNIDVTEEFVSPQTLVALLFNALTVDVYEQVSFGSDMIKYGLIEGKNLLLQTFGISYGEGIVSANRYTSLTGGGTDDDTMIEIKEIGFFRAPVEAASLLGYDTDYFYKDETSVPVIVCIFPKSSNEALAVADMDFESFENGYLIYLDSDGSEKKKKTDPLFDVIYNGAAHTAWEAKDFDITNGSFEFVDNDNDSDIDVIFINSYVDYVVRSVSAANESIALDFGKGTILLDDDSYINRFVFESAPADFSQLITGDVISVGESFENGGVKVRNFIVSRSAFSGSISGMGDDTVTLGGKEYRFVQYPGQLEVYLGLGGKFYVNALGKVIACDSADRYTYGYVRAAKLIGNLDAGIRVQLSCAAGPECDYALSDNVKIDGLSSLTDGQILNRIKAGELIRYRVNNNGEIISADTLQPGSGNADDELSLDDSNTRIRYKSNARFFYAGGNLETTHLVDTETVIFFVPESESSDEYTVANYSQLVNDQYYNAEFYDLSEMLVSGALVIKTDASNKAPGDNEPIAVITGIGEKLSADGDTVVSLKVFKSGLEIKDYWIASEDSDIYSTLKVGDIVQFSTGSEAGKIISVRVLHSASAGTPYGRKTLSTINTALNISWGEVAAVDESTLLLNVNSDDPAQCDPYYLKSGLSFYIYDTDDMRVTLGSAADLAIGDKVFLRENYYAVQEGVIVR